MEDYGLDKRGKPVSGGQWPRGMKTARSVSFNFQKVRVPIMNRLHLLIRIAAATEEPVCDIRCRERGI